MTKIAIYKNFGKQLYSNLAFTVCYRKCVSDLDLFFQYSCQIQIQNETLLNLHVGPGPCVVDGWLDMCEGSAGKATGTIVPPAIVCEPETHHQPFKDRQILSLGLLWLSSCIFQT